MDAVRSGRRFLEAYLTKVLLIVGFVLALSTLGFAAANAGVPAAPEQMLVGGQMVAVDYD
jgi:hypothetical protein